MKDFLASLGLPAGVSLLLVLPFVILEFTFNTVSQQDAPSLIVLFGLLWLLATAFIAILSPIVRSVRAGNRMKANPVLLLRVVSLVLIAMMWGSILVDQFPCFLGVPNCD